MTLKAFIFDVDGTLLNTNWAHVEAWRRAFAHFGYTVDPARIALEIGKGGDKLVPDLVGEPAEREHGEALRQEQGAEFLHIAAQTRFAPFPGVADLFHALHARGLKTALATSARRDHFAALCQSAGLDLAALADELVTSSDVEGTKPEPDIVLAAVDRLGLDPGACIMVGDTPHDAEAARRGGVLFLGILGGAWTAGDLLRAGAAGVWRDPADLRDHLDQALALADRAAQSAPA